MEIEKEEERVSWDALPEFCIANILSFTNPREACRLSLISPTFRSAAISDTAWERFLPSDYQDILSRSVDSSSLNFSSKKQLYMSLCHDPILIDEGRRSFSLEKSSGKKCYMIGARDLIIAWSDTPCYWDWISVPDSRFPEVAKLIGVWWFEIRGKIETSMLSPSTNYEAYLVFNVTEDVYGFEYPAEASIGLVGSECCSSTKAICLDTTISTYHEQEHHGLDYAAFRQLSELPQPKKRGDGWFEVELGEYYYNGDKDDDFRDLEISVMEAIAGERKWGIILQGIEIRSKVCKTIMSSTT